ncbi:MAG: hypothetical protein EOP78_01375 [Variovorax sp.]|nr:MAG: hypothetical protein EOP78_01375 [Variovorax sp.]
MAHQIFLISLSAAAQDDDAARDDIAETLHRVGGFVLMAAGAAALITAFDEKWVPIFKQHPAVESCGGLNLDPNGAAADKLRHLFAANVAAQLAARAGPEAGVPEAAPRYRPLVWHRSAFQHPSHATGVSVSTQPIARGPS